MGQLCVTLLWSQATYVAGEAIAAWCQQRPAVRDTVRSENAHSHVLSVPKCTLGNQTETCHLLEMRPVKKQGRGHKAVYGQSSASKGHLWFVPFPLVSTWFHSILFFFLHHVLPRCIDSSLVAKLHSEIFQSICLPFETTRKGFSNQWLTVFHFGS